MNSSHQEHAIDLELSEYRYSHNCSIRQVSGPCETVVHKLNSLDLVPDGFCPRWALGRGVAAKSYEREK